MSAPARRPAIDTCFDTAFADRLARYETYNKHHYRPNTYLHKWWGRRCGTTFRLILKGLVDDPARAGYYTAGGLEGKVILDPMMGGGTTLHEAIRLGAAVMGVDIDPIPVLQARATLTDREPRVLAAGFRRLFDGLRAEIDDLYTTHCPLCDEPVPFWYALYGLRRECACGEVLVVDSLLIRDQPDGGVLRICPFCGELHGGSEHGCGGTVRRIVEKTQEYCAGCGGRYADREDRPFHARYEMLAIAGHCPSHDLFHRVPDWRDRERHEAADGRRSGLPFSPALFRVIPGDKSIQLSRRNVHSYLDLFSSRQLLFLDAVARHLPDDDPIVRLNLALLVSTSLEFNSMLCGYKGVSKRRAGAVRHAFAHHGYAFPYTALEANPIYPRAASGTLQKLFQSRVVRGRRWAAEPLERDLDAPAAQFVPITGERDGGEEVTDVADLYGPQRFHLLQGTSTSLPSANGSVDAVVTDPPYYDSIQYGDLAAFFRVWLRQFLPEAADWAYDGAGAAVNSERDAADHRYVQMMGGIFRECRRVLRPESGRLIFTFHHWQPDAWAALALALRAGGFALLNRYVVHAEHPMSVHINNMRALTHDAILVLAPLPIGHVPAWERPPFMRADSYGFTEDCATLMGWVLANGSLTPDEVVRVWQQSLAAVRVPAALPVT